MDGTNFIQFNIKPWKLLDLNYGGRFVLLLYPARLPHGKEGDHGDHKTTEAEDAKETEVEK